MHVVYEVVDIKWMLRVSRLSYLAFSMKGYLKILKRGDVTELF